MEPCNQKIPIAYSVYLIKTIELTLKLNNYTRTDERVERMNEKNKTIDNNNVKLINYGTD